MAFSSVFIVAFPNHLFVFSCHFVQVPNKKSSPRYKEITVLTCNLVLCFVCVRLFLVIFMAVVRFTNAKRTYTHALRAVFPAKTAT